MSKHFGYEAFLFIYNQDEITQIHNSCPFSVQEGLHCYAFVGISNIAQTLLLEFTKVIAIDAEKAQIHNGIFYWQIPKGQTLTSAFSKVLGKKSLKNQITNRNLNTFAKILTKMA